MNRLFLLAVTMIFFASCSSFPVSNEQKAHELVEEYMKHNLNDPDSYESVDYTQLDSLFINPGVKKMADELLEISNDHDQYNKIIRAEKHKFSGFSLIHTFRVKNGTGGIETYTWQFNFNSTLENIYNIEKSGYH